MILFCVSAHNIDIASIRYRAMLPALYLNRAGVAAEVVSPDLTDEVLRRAKCLVVVKSFDQRILNLSWKASRYGVPVVLDLCDDIFDDSYGGLGGDIGKYYFPGLAKLASVIVTTTPGLAERIRQSAPPDTPIQIIPDMVERVADVVALERLYRPPPAEPTPIQKSKKPKTLSSKLRRKVKNGARWLSRILGRRLARLPEVSTPVVPAVQAGPPVTFDDDKVVLWFGHHGSLHSDTGMAQLLFLAADLARLAREHPLRLVVVSNSREKFERYIRPLPFRSEFIEWSPETMHAQLERADVCVLPFGRDKFSLAKSPNRIALSLAACVPVVASPLPSLGALADCILIEDWYASIKTYLERPDVASAHLALAQRVLQAHFDGSQIAALWCRTAASARERRRTAPARPTLLFFFQLPQDFDLLLPLLKAAREEFDVTIGILAGLSMSAPSQINSLAKYGRRTFFLHEFEFPSLDVRDPRLACNALITATESSASPHQFAAQLTKVVRANGVSAITMQHGVENIGLNYKDSRYDETISFESDLILTWGRRDRLASWVPEQTRSKLVPIGCPKPVLEKSDVFGFPLAHRPFIAVFENLHWSRYSDEYRVQFLSDLSLAARSIPDLTFALKPHPVGAWFTVRREMDHDFPANVVVADPKSLEWGRFGVDAFLAFAIGAITTPSSTAFDAARYLKPVAVVGGDLDLEMYEPLPALRSGEDWVAFLSQIKQGTVDLSSVRTYRDSVSIVGDSIHRAMTAFRLAANHEGAAAVAEAVAALGHGPDVAQGEMMTVSNVVVL